MMQGYLAAARRALAQSQTDERRGVDDPGGDSITDSCCEESEIGEITVPTIAATSLCPTCGDPGERQGTYRLADGRGRFACQRCSIVWWAPIEHVGDVAVVPGAWWAPYGYTLTDEQYDAIVSWDILHHGYHVGNRHYAEPAEPPERIWAQLGLTSNGGITSG
jgi:hypothetical protein